MSTEEFWALIDAAIALIANTFSLMDGVVIIDEPRFTLFNFAVSVIFVGLLIHTINWLRGVPGGLNSMWDDYQERKYQERVRDSLGAVNYNMESWRLDELNQAAKGRRWR